MDEPRMSSDILSAALSYARRGWGVIPLHTPTADGCSCGRGECSSVGKHPRTQNGLKDATTDEAIIRAWWNRWAEANVGVVTGAASGLVVLDQDGPEAEEGLRDKHLPLTPCAETGKGVHRYFAHPGWEVRNFARKLPGLDLRGDGGYVVAPPSLHSSGRRYGWAENLCPEGTDPAPCPEWLIDLIQEPSNDSTPAVAGDEIGKGQRNTTLASLAGTMRRRGMSEEAILVALREENRNRCVPPLLDHELVAVTKSISSYSPEVVESPQIEIKPRPVAGLVPAAIRYLDGEIDGLLTNFSTLDRKIMGLVGLVLIGAPPKVGKSTFCLNIALHVAQQRDDATVLYFDIENGQSVIMARLLANFYGLTINDLRKKTGMGEVWEADLAEKLSNFELYTDASQMHPDAIARRLQDVESKKKLLVLDSLQKLPPLARQRRDSIDTWLRELEQIKQDPNIVILLVSELSRGENEVNYRRASLGSFKESGGAEYSCDLGLQFVGKREDTVCELHCVANRHGMSGRIAEYDRREFAYWRWVEVLR